MTQGRHSRRGGRSGLQAEVGRLRALVARLREESAATSRDLAAERVAAADAAGRVTALRDEVALLRSRLDEAAGTVAAHAAESERLRADLVLARGTARYAERAAEAEAADLRAQVADLQRRLDDASGLVGSVTRAVAERVAGSVAGAGAAGGPSPDALPGRTAEAPAADRRVGAEPVSSSTGVDVAGAGTPALWSGGAGGSTTPVRPWVDGRHAAGAPAYRVALVAPVVTDGPVDEGPLDGGPSHTARRDPDADVAVEVDPRVDPWGRPLPPTGSA